MSVMQENTSPPGRSTTAITARAGACLRAWVPSPPQPVDLSASAGESAHLDSYQPQH